MAEKNDLSDLYETAASAYDEEIKRVEYQAPSWIKSIYKDLGKKFTNHLDLGCGTGLVAEVLNGLGCSAERIGVDFSAAMLKQAEAKAIYTTLKRLDLSEGLTLDCSEKFDLVTALGLFDDLYPHPQLLKDIKGVLADGGEVWMTLQKEIEEVPYAIERPKEWVQELAGDYQFTRQQVENLLKQGGLKPIDIEARWGYTLNPQLLTTYLFKAGQEVRGSKQGVLPPDLQRKMPVDYFFIRAR